MKKDHILVIRFSALGDTAMVVPIVYSLAEAYPDLRITVLSRPFARSLFENLHPNIFFMEADLKKEYKGIKGLNALYRRLSAKKFTAVADLHDVLRSEYLRLRFQFDYISKVRHIDKHREDKRHLMRSKNKILQQLPTSFDNYTEVFHKLGYNFKPHFTSLFPPGGGPLERLPQSISQRSQAGPWIGIAPFAAHQGKVYPIERMEEVIGMIARKYEHSSIFLFGRGEKEDETFARWCQRFAQCVHVAPQLQSLDEELVLMSHLQVLVSRDSANMHLASLTATPVVSVWGATHPYSGFLGWNQKSGNIVQLDLPCRPCSIYGNKPCLTGDFACMKQIPAEVIFSKIEDNLKKSE